MRAVELERCDGDRAGADGSIVRVGLDPVGELLFVQPEVGPATRVHGLLEQIAGYLLRLLREPHAARPSPPPVQGSGTFTFSRTPSGRPSFRMSSASPRANRAASPYS